MARPPHESDANGEDRRRGDRRRRPVGGRATAAEGAKATGRANDAPRWELVGNGSPRRVAQVLVTVLVDAAALAASMALVGGSRPQLTAVLLGALLLGAGLTIENPFATFGGHLGRRWLRLAAVAGIVSLAISVLAPATAPQTARLAGTSLLALGVGRSLLRAVALCLRHFGIWLERTVIVGAGQVGQELAEALLRRRRLGLAPIGFVDDIADDPAPLPLLGSPLGLRQVLTEHHATAVLLAFGPVKDPELVHRIRQAVTGQPVRVFCLPRFFELGVARHVELDTVWGYPIMELAPPPQRRATWRLKRLVDVAVASALLAVLSPLLALLALLVRRSGPGGVLFRQERIGLYGEPVQVLKFRTMEPNADSDVRWSVDDDDRVTRVGHVMRRTHLDELPQLVNVVRGEMSLVGPRPERPHFAEQFSDEIHDYRHRHRVPVGITGLAQVNGLWGDTSIRDRARLDNRYIEDWSLLSDLRILARTLGTITGGRGDAPEAEQAPAVPPTGDGHASGRVSLEDRGGRGSEPRARETSR